LGHFSVVSSQNSSAGVGSSGTAFLLLLFFLDVHNPRTPLIVGIKAIDWFGTVTILGLMVMLLLGLDFGGARFPWKSPTVIGLIVAGGLYGRVFLVE
jgi:hypothetical protein